MIVAQAAPALGQVFDTPSSPVIIDFDASTACKIPGANWSPQCYVKGYVLWAKFINTTSVDITIDEITRMIVGGIEQPCIVGMTIPSEACSALVTEVIIPAGENLVVGIFSNAADDSSNTDVQVFLNYTPDGGVQKEAILGGTITSTVAPWTKGVASCLFPPGCDEKKNTPPPACGCAV